VEVLVEAIGTVPEAVRARSAPGFFGHCEHRIPIQSL
jgi:hypothetical protein